MVISTVYLVAGASRGLGLALVGELASRDTSAIVYAGVRNPSSSSKLIELADRYPERIQIAKFIAGDKAGNEHLAEQIKNKHGRIDTVIANAAIASNLGNIHESAISTFEEHFAVNVLGPIVLFQAFRNLLKASSLPRFIAISCGAGGIEGIAKSPFNLGSFGTSKAALNWAVRKIHYENEWLITFPLSPGAIATDMARKTAASTNDAALIEMLKKISVKPEVAASSLLDIITASTREDDGGQFHNIDERRIPW